MKKGYVVIETEECNSGRYGTAVASKIYNSQVYFDRKKADDARDQSILDRKDYFVSVWENDEEETVPGSFQEGDEYENVYFEDDFSSTQDDTLILYVTVNDDDEYTYYYSVAEVDIED